MPKRVVVASTNPVKIDAVRMGFQTLFPDDIFSFEGLAVDSGVGPQPMSDRETLLGAENRAAAARTARLQADDWVGIEGGIEAISSNMTTFAWVVVLGSDRKGRSRTASHELPNRVARLVQAGLELGEADDQVYGRVNSKQDNGSAGLLTGNAVTRTQLYAQAVSLALIPFKNPNLYEAGC